MRRREDKNEDGETEPHPPELEAEFRKVCETHLPVIREKLAAAQKLVTEATAIASEHGIPFHGMSDLRQEFAPEKFWEKFGELDADLIEELTNHVPDSDTVGWKFSDVCYG